MLLLTRDVNTDEGYQETFREFALKFEHQGGVGADRVSFAYVCESTQADFVHALTAGQGVTNETAGSRKVGTHSSVGLEEVFEGVSRSFKALQQFLAVSLRCVVSMGFSWCCFSVQSPGKSLKPHLSWF